RALQPAAVQHPVLAARVDDRAAMRFEPADGRGRAAVNELRAELERCRESRRAFGQYPSADARARLEHADAAAATIELGRCRQARGARADDDDFAVGHALAGRSPRIVTRCPERTAG